MASNTLELKLTGNALELKLTGDSVLKLLITWLEQIDEKTVAVPVHQELRMVDEDGNAITAVVDWSSFKREGK